MSRCRCVNRNRWLMTAVVALAPLVSFGGERELWFLWNKHLKDVEDHAGILQTCQAYATKFPEDPLLPVVRSLEAWHLLSEGKSGDALKRFATQLAGGPSGLERGVQRVARSWVTRLQQEQLVDALQYYYKKEVGYPERLEKLVSYPGLPGAGRLPMKDAWNVSWRYRLVGFKGVPGFRDQKYELGSNSLPDSWDTAEALTIPYASRIHAQPVRSKDRGVPGVQVIKLNFTSGEKKGQTILGQVGEEVEGLTVAYAGKDLVILCDALHWNILLWTK